MYSNSYKKLSCSFSQSKFTYTHFLRISVLFYTKHFPAAGVRIQKLYTSLVRAIGKNLWLIDRRITTAKGDHHYKIT